MYFTDRHQALQDLAAGTVVVPYDAGRAQAGWFDPARGTDRTYMMPHWLRRLAAIVVYELVFGFVFIATIVFRLLPNCYRGRPPRVSCSAADTLLTNVMMLSLLFGLFAISVAGALGFLWGARRRLSARI